MTQQIKKTREGQSFTCPSSVRLGYTSHFFGLPSALRTTTFTKQPEQAYLLCDVRPNISAARLDLKNLWKWGGTSLTIERPLEYNTFEMRYNVYINHIFSRGCI